MSATAPAPLAGYLGECRSRIGIIRRLVVSWTRRGSPRRLARLVARGLLRERHIRVAIVENSISRPSRGRRLLLWKINAIAGDDIQRACTKAGTHRRSFTSLVFACYRRDPKCHDIYVSRRVYDATSTARGRFASRIRARVARLDWIKIEIHSIPVFDNR